MAAVDGCCFAVDEGTITALIGPNGSGKTTAFNIITGYLPADSGAVRFAGRRCAGQTRRGSHRAGLARTFQQARVFPELTRRREPGRGAAAAVALAPAQDARASRARARRRAARGVRPDARRRATGQATLSFGQRKLLEFASLLMGEPRLVLLDEPTAGVNPVMVETMERHIRELHARGLTFLIVEHDMHLVMRLCEPVIVLDHGATIATGRAARRAARPAGARRLPRGRVTRDQHSTASWPGTARATSSEASTWRSRAAPSPA